ncbi:hypothetical protein EMPS_00214 [Entomortierella parvispora]|uniref:Uncharacterized protein n=1 Tax=Entomortierella parvispora TaxID=205924 RepID=A0A9P3LR63_9FUNG|nr:hypothetical protein EMPS_00214 [Entomortierella parvispora]
MHKHADTKPALICSQKQPLAPVMILHENTMPQLSLLRNQPRYDYIRWHQISASLDQFAYDQNGVALAIYGARPTPPMAKF